MTFPVRIADAGANQGSWRRPVAIQAIKEMIAQRDLLWAFVELRLRSRAKRSVVGTFWPITAPFFLLVLYVYIFKRVFNVPIPRYTEYLFAGLLPWSFVTSSLNQCLTSLTANNALVRRAPFARELLPISAMCVSGVYMLVTLLGWLGYLAVRGHLTDWSVLPFLVVPLTALFLLVGAIGLVLSSIDVRTRDLRFVLGNLLTVWFFALPILYRRQMAPRPLQALRSIDPMNMIIGQFRDILHFGDVSRPSHMALMLLMSGVAFLVGVTVFRRTTREVAKEV